MVVIKISNLSELEAVVEDIKKQIEPQIGKKTVMLCLVGDLGAGKTAFAKIMLKKLGVVHEVVSPTYVLHNSYTGRQEVEFEINHIDLWRMDNISELMGIGFEEMVRNRSVIVVEWADKFKEEISRYAETCLQIWIEIVQGQEEGSRTIRIGK